MISNLILPSVSFKGQDNNSAVKNSYKELLKRNEQIAAKANAGIENSVASTSGKQINMQGNAGQKLDVIA